MDVTHSADTPSPPVLAVRLLNRLASGQKSVKGECNAWQEY